MADGGYSQKARIVQHRNDSFYLRKLRFRDSQPKIEGIDELASHILPGNLQ